VVFRKTYFQDGKLMADHYSDFYDRLYKEIDDARERDRQIDILGTDVTKEVESTGCFQLDLFDENRNRLGTHFFDLYVTWKDFSNQIDKLGYSEKKFLTSILK
jgi:hypothetical protein